MHTPWHVHVHMYVHVYVHVHVHVHVHHVHVHVHVHAHTRSSISSERRPKERSERSNRWSTSFATEAAHGSTA